MKDQRGKRHINKHLRPNLRYPRQDTRQILAHSAPHGIPSSLLRAVRITRRRVRKEVNDGEKEQSAQKEPKNRQFCEDYFEP